MSSAFKLPRVARSATVACLVNWARCSCLVVYLGTEGLEQHRRIQSGKLHAGSPEFIYSQHVSQLGLAIEANSTKPISKLSNSSASSFIAAMRGRNFAVSNRAIIRGISRKVRRGISLCAWGRHDTLRYVLRRIQIGFTPRIRIITLFAFQSTNRHNRARHMRIPLLSNRRWASSYFSNRLTKRTDGNGKPSG